MSNIIHLRGEAETRPQPRTRGPYRRKVTAAEIERAVTTAAKLGLTIYGVTIDGEKIHLQTRPASTADNGKRDAVEAYFAQP